MIISGGYSCDYCGVHSDTTDQPMIFNEKNGAAICIDCVRICNAQIVDQLRRRADEGAA